MLTITGFDSNANESNSEDEISVAKKSTDHILNTEKFWIKICTNGLNSGRFFDPSTNMVEELKRYDSYNGKHRYSYKLVNKDCFDLYMLFLKTKNSSFLKNAERNM